MNRSMLVLLVLAAVLLCTAPVARAQTAPVARGQTAIVARAQTAPAARAQNGPISVTLDKSGCKVSDERFTCTLQKGVVLVRTTSKHEIELPPPPKSYPTSASPPPLPLPPQFSLPPRFSWTMDCGPRLDCLPPETLTLTDSQRKAGFVAMAKVKCAVCTFLVNGGASPNRR